MDRMLAKVELQCTCCRYQRPGRAQLAVWRRLIGGCFANSKSECGVRDVAPALCGEYSLYEGANRLSVRPCDWSQGHVAIEDVSGLRVGTDVMLVEP